MRQYRRIIILFAVALVVVVVGYILRGATKPMSSIIAEEREILTHSVSEGADKLDPEEVRKKEAKIKLLGFRLAMAYNKEGKPDKAIAVLEELIQQERSKEPRTALSYHDEARYYGILAASYELKGDEAAAEKARSTQGELISQSVQMKKQERAEEGKVIRRRGD